MTQSLLIVEDDISLGTEIKRTLCDAGYTVFMAHTAETGFKQVLDHKPDLILLDVMVPVMGGWELCRQLRQHTKAPILFLTALNSPDNIVKGLQLGADDYIIKPFHEEILLARIAAHLRRQGGHFADRLVFDNGALEIDLENVMVLIEGRPVDLTPREFELFSVLARHAGQVMRTADLLIEAWGAEYADATENIKPYIHYLRKKIEKDPTTPRWIKTVRGVGYRFGD